MKFEIYNFLNEYSKLKGDRIEDRAFQLLWNCVQSIFQDISLYYIVAT